jgi:hypothetical protein
MFGFPADNIAVWDTSAEGLAEVGETIRRTTDTYRFRLLDVDTDGYIRDVGGG